MKWVWSSRSRMYISSSNPPLLRPIILLAVRCCPSSSCDDHIVSIYNWRWWPQSLDAFWFSTVAICIANTFHFDCTGCQLQCVAAISISLINVADGQDLCRNHSHHNRNHGFEAFSLSFVTVFAAPSAPNIGIWHAIRTEPYFRQYIVIVLSNKYAMHERSVIKF